MTDRYSRRPTRKSDGGSKTELFQPRLRRKVEIADRIAIPNNPASAPALAESVLLAVVNANNSLYDVVEADALINKWAQGELLNIAEHFWIHDQSVQMVRTLSREPVGWITQTMRNRFRSLTGEGLPPQIFFETNAIYGFFVRAPRHFFAGR